ncbi:MAG: hypothetical protein PUH88_01005 [Lachnospiraceae bacterium]|nr:hypothetical protein [Lachnospiraceae bacterium]
MEISSRAVYQDEIDKDETEKILDGNQRLDGQNTEANSIKEQTVYYDIRFGAILPGEKETIKVIINLEIQLDDTPGYPIVKRGFYYCGRMISEQYGTVFTKEEYDKLEKVYSIWICPSPVRKRKNGIFRYHIMEDTIVGESYTDSDDYDMIEVIIHRITIVGRKGTSGFYYYVDGHLTKEEAVLQSENKKLIYVNKITL